MDPHRGERTIPPMHLHRFATLLFTLALPAVPLAAQEVPPADTPPAEAPAAPDTKTLLADLHKQLATAKAEALKKDPEAAALAAQESEARKAGDKEAMKTARQALEAKLTMDPAYKEVLVKIRELKGTMPKGEKKPKPEKEPKAE